MFKKFTRIAVVGAAIAASTVGLISSNALAGPPLGPVSVGTASGTDATVFTMLPPLNSACTGSGAGTFENEPLGRAQAVVFGEF